MTVLEASPSVVPQMDHPAEGQPQPDAHVDAQEGRRRSRPLWVRITVVGATVVGTFVVTVAVIVYGIGPLIHSRDQRALVAAEQSAIAQAAVARNGLYGVRLPTQPPAPGSVVGLLAIPALGLNQAVVEGAQPSQTIGGPGHVPGTAGLGQPGNAAVVARNAGFGAPFARIGQLKKGDKIVVATIEGVTTYIVRQVRVVNLVGPASQSASANPTTFATPRGHGLPSATPSGTPSVPGTTLYGPTNDDQLTLVTSNSATPWNSSSAQTVVARMVGKPFAPTPQQSASPSQYGTSGDSSAWSLFILALLLLGGAVVGSIYLYRRTSTRVAYLLTTAPIIAATVLAALAVSRLLPAWM